MLFRWPNTTRPREGEGSKFYPMHVILKVAQAILVQCFVHPQWGSYVWFDAFGRSEMTLRDARGVVMEKESREARQSARNNVIL